MLARPSSVGFVEKLRQASRALRGDRSGNTAILFSLAVVPLLGVLGLAVDYGRLVRYRTQLQSAVDAAAIAGADAQSNGKDATSAAKSFMAKTYAGVGASASTTVTPDASTASVTVRADLAVPTTFMKVLGPGSATVRATATASQGAAGAFTEIAIALDTTGSMTGSKLKTAQDAAKKLVDTLFAQPGAKNYLKVGFVPFDTYVNVGTAYRGASWLTNTTDYSTANPPACWNTYPDAKRTSHVWTTRTCYNDGNPYDCSGYVDSYDYGSPQQVCGPQGDSTYTWYGCVGSQDFPYDVSDVATSTNRVPALFNTGCSSPLVRLTDVPGQVKSAISQTNASNETYIAPAMTWAWRLLSPKAPFADAKPYNSAAKTIVLMTDGANTRAPNYPQHGSSDANLADQRLRQVCANVKNAGITIYTIAFSVTDAGIKGLLSDCASGQPFYYDAKTDQELSDAFNAIGAQLTALRIVK